MELLKVNSLPVHDIIKYSVKRQDLDGPDSTRSETGVLSREIIRQGVFTLEIAVTFYSDAELNALINELKQEVINTDFYFGSAQSIQAYSSNQTIDLKTNTDGTPYWDISFNIIEY